LQELVVSMAKITRGPYTQRAIGFGESVAGFDAFSVPFVKWGMKDPSNFLLHVKDTVDIDIHTAGEIASGVRP
jgi:hypothetical protein